MKTVYRAHPLMIIKFTKPFLIVLLFPLLRALLQYFARGEIKGLVTFEIITLLVILGFAVARFLAFRVYCNDKTVTVRMGVLFVRRAEIEIAKLSSVQTERTPIDYLCGAMTFRINTEAGTKNHPDFEFKVSFSRGKELSRRLYSEEPVSNQRFSAFKIAIMAAATSSAFTGLIIGVPIINRAGNLFGIALSEMLFNEINNVSSKIETHFPPIVNTITLIFLLAYAISFIYSFCKYLNFKVVLGENQLEVRSGFFSKCRTSFKKSSVNNVLIVQTPLMLLFKRFAMKVSVGGFGESKSEPQIVVPSGKYEEIKKDFSLYFPFLIPAGNPIIPKRNLLCESRFLFWPGVCLLILLSLSIPCALIFAEFTQFVLFLTLVGFAVIAFFAYISILEYKHSSIEFSENIFAKGVKGFRTRELYCPKEKVGQIRLTRFFTDFYYKTCKIKLTICSENADSIFLRHLDFETVKKNILNCYGIEE